MRSQYNLQLIFILLITSFCDCQKRNHDQATTNVQVFSPAPTKEFVVNCYTPQYYIHLYTTNCTSTSGKYPSDHVICRCTHCKSLEFHLRCHVKGTWYPDIPEKCNPANLKKYPECNLDCGDDSPVPASVRNVHYNLNSVITMPKFHCRKNCREIPLVCNKRRRIWDFESKYWIESCESTDLTYTQIYKKQNLTVEVNKNIVKYSCKGDYELKGKNSLECKDGMLSGELPACITAKPQKTVLENSNQTDQSKTGDEKLTSRERLLLPIAITMAVLFLISFGITLTFIVCWCKSHGTCCFVNNGTYIDASEVQNKPIPLQTFSRTQAKMVPEYLETFETNHYEEIKTVNSQQSRHLLSRGQNYNTNNSIPRESNLYDDIGPNLPPIPKL